jgi:hypothetical protein
MNRTSADPPWETADARDARSSPIHQGMVMAIRNASSKKTENVSWSRPGRPGSGGRFPGVAPGYARRELFRHVWRACPA